MEIQLWFNRVLVRPVEQEEIERSGLIIPDGADNNMVTGEIILIGNEVKYAQVGMKILYKENAGEELIIDGEPVLILLEAMVEAVI